VSLTSWAGLLMVRSINKWADNEPIPNEPRATDFFASPNTVYIFDGRKAELSICRLRHSSVIWVWWNLYSTSELVNPPSLWTNFRSRWNILSDRKKDAMFYMTRDWKKITEFWSLINLKRGCHVLNKYF
jgi:hypothetical protein